MSYLEHWTKSIENPEAFWGPISRNLHWFKTWEKVLDDANPPFYRWFLNGETNLCYNCVDRWLDTPKADKAAYIYENPVENVSITLTYRQLFQKVNEVGGLFQKLNLTKGDRVIIYLPMSIEACVVSLACVRLGIIHSIIFAGFSKEAIAVRIDDATPKLIITADASKRANKITHLKEIIDDAIEIAHFKVPQVLILNTNLKKFDIVANRDLDWKTELSNCKIKKTDPVKMKSQDPSYILYTSGTTGKPKGVLRDTGGYMVALYYSMFSLFGCNENSIYFATSDIGWVVGHSYTIYGPLLGGMTSIIYDGTPINPHPGIWFEIMQKYQTDVVFSSPTAFRMLRKYPEENITSFNLKNLKYLFLAGEPLDPATYEWVKRVLGPEVSIVDNYWQTETGWPVLCNPMGVEPLLIKPGSPTKPTWGWNLAVVDAEGIPCKPNEKGFLIAHGPTPPGVMLSIWNGDERYVQTYWKIIPNMNVYYTGDYAILDDDSYYYVLGRADEVIKVASHRLGTRELEELLNSHPKVAENSVIGIKDAMKGQVPLVLIVLKNGFTGNSEIKQELRNLIRDGIGPIATPKDIIFVQRLPKTRSGKVMRRIIKSLAEGDLIGDLSTIEDSAAVEEIRKAIEALIQF